MDDYKQIAAKLTHPEEEPSYLISLCLLPGTTKTIELKIPEEKPIAFYALFTNPGDGWKMILNTEVDYKKVVVILGEHEIQSVRFE